MKKWEIRREILLKELSIRGKLSLEQIQALLNISESTARRLIVELEHDNCLIRCFGGVQKIHPSSWKYSYEETQENQSLEKQRIGEFAASLIEDGDVIYLSGGSTVRFMANALENHIQSGRITNISVITNSLVSAEALADCINVIMPGGTYRRRLRVLDGSLTEKNLRTMCFTKAFLGVVTVSRTGGFMTSDIETNSIIEVVLSKSSSFYVLADSSKFGKESFISYGSVQSASGIITDLSLSPEIKEIMEEQGAVFHLV